MQITLLFLGAVATGLVIGEAVLMPAYSGGGGGVGFGFSFRVKEGNSSSGMPAFSGGGFEAQGIDTCKGHVLRADEGAGLAARGAELTPALPSPRRLTPLGSPLRPFSAFPVTVNSAISGIRDNASTPISDGAIVGISVSIIVCLFFAQVVWQTYSWWCHLAPGAPRLSRQHPVGSAHCGWMLAPC